MPLMTTPARICSLNSTLAVDAFSKPWLIDYSTASYLSRRSIIFVLVLALYSAEAAGLCRLILKSQSANRRDCDPSVAGPLLQSRFREIEAAAVRQRNPLDLNRFEQPVNIESNFHAILQQLSLWKTVCALAVASLKNSRCSCRR
jgi:hypothetical protein